MYPIHSIGVHGIHNFFGVCTRSMYPDLCIGYINLYSVLETHKKLYYELETPTVWMFDDLF
jgi:hypothetical protein